MSETSPLRPAQREEFEQLKTAEDEAVDADNATEEKTDTATPEPAEGGRYVSEAEDVQTRHKSTDMSDEDRKEAGELEENVKNDRDGDDEPQPPHFPRRAPVTPNSSGSNKPFKPVKLVKSGK
ncbi:hypothetical protein E1B28_003580 [Marasmius oreades]|uniref:Uncharacterized protein n=1 Tax=Marasmius oreades TaxID=181124 RepID=A0A9P7UL15_9AGAR|nr:uncharacterized protein E1B28_003580 [Marasmius oreades]KAG7086060.1 hypothetical protein E1B28_003580 [Marasmius oreades]